MIGFSFQEVVTSLLKQQGIHEGYWSFYVRFGLSAANINVKVGFTSPDGSPMPTGPLDLENDTFAPAAILPIQEIGISRVNELNNLSVDAAVVNPKPVET